MKKGIHPKTHKVIFHDLSSGAEFISTSILSSEEEKTVNGVKYKIIKVDISSASHPFYTGTQQLSTKGNQVAKYLERAAKAKASSEAKKKKSE